MGKFDSVYDICVIGAGASGMMAAITASRQGARVCLIERNERVGNKILKTGNGRCNLSHIPVTGNEYRGSGSDRIREYLDLFDVSDTLDFFRGIGLLTRQKDGYVYPYSESASAVLDVLRFSLNYMSVDVHTCMKVNGLSGRPDGGYDIYCRYEDKEHDRSDKVTLLAKRVILCTGGAADPGTGSDGSGYEIVRKLGIRIIKPVPALVKVRVNDPAIVSLAGVRAKGIASIVISDKIHDPAVNGSDGTANVTYEGEDRYTIADRGEIQFTKDGLSGIPIFNLSRYISETLDTAGREQVDLDLIPDMDIHELTSYLFGIIERSGEKGCEIFTGIVHKKIILYVFKRMGISPDIPACEISSKKIKELAALLKHMSFEVTSVYGFEQAQVTAGGVDFGEVDEELQLKSVPGLFLAGELLDIDGPCGGYNLQWAWTSGHIAATGAVRSLNMGS